MVTTELRTKRAVAGTFFSQGSPRIVVGAALVLVFARVLLGDWSWVDLLIVVVVLVATGLVEWFIHLHLLHAPDESIRMRWLHTGTGHREHHLDPSQIEWVLLGPVDAATYTVALGAFTAVWSLPLLWIIGGPLWTGLLTASAASIAQLAHYEWSHLLFHTRYRPKSRLYKRLERNHTLHHYRNEDYWLGVTSNLGDRILRTLPKAKGDVPMSDTARTLG